MEKRGPLEIGMANHFSILALRTINSKKRKKDKTVKDELSRPVGDQYATGEEWRNSSRKNEESEPKRKQSVVYVTGDESKVQCCKK